MRAALVFLLGAPRSGTSWLQEEIARALNLAAAPETHYVAEFARPALIAWDRRRRSLDRLMTPDIGPGNRPSDRLVGLPAVVDEDVFVDSLRGPLAATVADARMAGATGLLEKTPSNSVLVPYITRLWPDSQVVHVVRDPRSVVRSLRAASAGWGAEWAPRSVTLSALMWRAHIVGAERAVGSVDAYVVVRYEDARKDLPQTLERVRAALGRPGLVAGVDSPPLALSSRVRAALDGRLIEPEGFGSGEQRHPPLGLPRTWITEALCGDLMIRYGYRPRFRSATLAARGVRALFSSLGRHIRPELQEDLVMSIARLSVTRHLVGRRPADVGHRSPGES